MTRLVLHVGTHKTGTTTLQHVFEVNHRRLRRDEIVFPLLADNAAYAPRNHSSLAWSINHGDPTAAVPDQWAAVQDIVRDERPRDVVLIGEQLCRLLPERWARLRAILEAIAFDEVVVICYVRRQDAFLRSMYVQWVKSGRSASPFHELWPAYRDHRYLRYDRMYRDIVEHLAPDAVIVRPFERRQLSGGSVVEDFLAAADLEVDSQSLRDADIVMNEAVGTTSVRLMLIASAMAEVLGVRDRALRMAFRELRPIVQRLVTDDPAFVGWRRGQAATFLDGFASQNRTLAVAALGREDLFLDAPEDAGLDLPTCLDPDLVADFVDQVRRVLIRYA